MLNIQQINNVVINDSMPLEEKIKNSSADELVLMLYNGCLNFINIGKQCLIDKQYEQANINLQKAEKIVLELNNTLDFHYPISQQLSQLYCYTYDKLVEGNIKSDQQQLNYAKDIITDLRNVWLQAIEQIKYAQ